MPINYDVKYPKLQRRTIKLEATITRLRGRLERLGQTGPNASFHNSFSHIPGGTWDIHDYQQELRARIEYAKASLKENDDET